MWKKKGGPDLSFDWFRLFAAGAFGVICHFMPVLLELMANSGASVNAGVGSNSS